MLNGNTKDNNEFKESLKPYYQLKQEIANADPAQIQQHILEQSIQQNINLINMQIQLDRQNKMLKRMKFNLACITFVMIAPIILGIILFVISIFLGFNFFESFI